MSERSGHFVLVYIFLKVSYGLNCQQKKKFDADYGDM